MNKYDLYLNKYKALKGGSNPLFDVSFFNKDFEEIKKSLYITLSSNTYCPKILGAGAFGTVTVSTINDSMEIEINGKKIKLPVAIKKSKEPGNILFDSSNTINYIYSNKGIALEVIIFKFINELWLKKISPHLPYMVGYSCCGEKPNVLPDTIITERHGLDYDVDIEKGVKIFSQGPLWNNLRNNNVSLSTFQQLTNFMYLQENDNKVTFPNGITCNVTKFLDYFAISFLHTCYTLMKHNIYPSDLHGKNIFIHWLNDNSHVGDINIKNTKYIYYKFEDKIIKIKTYGIIIKFGDVGTFTMKVNDNLIIAGDKHDVVKNEDILKVVMTEKYNIGEALLLFYYVISNKLSKKTIMSEILANYPYNEQPNGHTKQSIIDDYLSISEILNKYEKYFVSEAINDKQSLIF